MIKKMLKLHLILYFVNVVGTTESGREFEIYDT